MQRSTLCVTLLIYGKVWRTLPSFQWEEGRWGGKGIGVEADPRGSRERELLQGRAGGKHAADSRFIRASD